jgi:hypothetical protein
MTEGAGDEEREGLEGHFRYYKKYYFLIIKLYI